MKLGKIKDKFFKDKFFTYSKKGSGANLDQRGVTALEFSMVFLLVTLLAIWIIEIGWSSWINSSVRFALHSAVNESMSDERLAPPISPRITASSSSSGSSSSGVPVVILSSDNRVYNDYVEAIQDIDRRFRESTIVQSLNKNIKFSGVTYDRVGDKPLTGTALLALPPGMKVGAKVEGVSGGQNSYLPEAISKKLSPREAVKIYPIEVTATYKLTTFFYGDRKYTVKIAAFPRISVGMGCSGRSCQISPTVNGVFYPPVVSSTGSGSCKVDCYNVICKEDGTIEGEGANGIPQLSGDPLNFVDYDPKAHVGAIGDLVACSAQNTCLQDARCNDPSMITTVLGNAAAPASCYRGCMEVRNGVEVGCRYNAGDVTDYGTCNCNLQRPQSEVELASTNCEVVEPGKTEACFLGCRYKDRTGAWQCDNSSTLLSPITPTKPACDSDYKECSADNSSGNNIIENPSSECLYNVDGSTVGTTEKPLCYKGCKYKKQDGTESCKNFGSGNILDLSLAGCKETECVIDPTCPAGNGNSCMIGCRLRSQIAGVQGQCSATPEDSFINPALNPKDSPSCFSYKKDPECVGESAQLKYQDNSSAVGINGINDENVCLVGGSVYTTNFLEGTEYITSWGKCYNSQINPTLESLNSQIKLFVDVATNGRSCGESDSCSQKICKVDASTATCENKPTLENSNKPCEFDAVHSSECFEKLCAIEQNDSGNISFITDPASTLITEQNISSWGCKYKKKDPLPEKCSQGCIIGDNSSCANAVDEYGAQLDPNLEDCKVPVCIRKAGEPIGSNIGECVYNELERDKFAFRNIGDSCSPENGLPPFFCNKFQCDFNGACTEKADPEKLDKKCPDDLLDIHCGREFGESSDSISDCKNCNNYVCKKAFDSAECSLIKKTEDAPPSCSNVNSCPTVTCDSDVDCFNDGDGNKCIDNCKCDLDVTSTNYSRCIKRDTPHVVDPIKECAIRPEIRNNILTSDGNIKPGACIRPVCDDASGCGLQIIPGACDDKKCEYCETIGMKGGDINPNYGRCVVNADDKRCRSCEGPDCDDGTCKGPNCCVGNDCNCR